MPAKTIAERRVAFRLESGKLSPSLTETRSRMLRSEP